LLSRANNLAFYELLGDAERMNREFAYYQQVNIDDIQQQAARIFQPERSNTLYYLAKSKTTV
jgi:zinc protease